uniref:Uncharacterized protein LOC105044818 isoform X3 n=1 Tax=Elaeis guineensis var. tenera TaxID=51953 RepID=A0A8N4EZ60_ELAGV|nr:uncharacterized protein LOC105044818 isoform X3 [Elaeis guineensis]
MESSKHQSWKISVHARSKGVDFRIDASNILPHWGKGGEKISLFLRLFRFFSLKAESKNRNPPRKTKRKSKLSHFLGNIFPRPRELIRNKLATKKRLQVRSAKIGAPPTNGCHHPCQVYLFDIQDMMVATMASLCLLSHSTVEKDGGGIIVHALAFIFCLVMLSRTSLIIETRRMILLIVLVLLPSFFCKVGEPKYLDTLGVYLSSAYSLVKGICNILVPYISTEQFHM